MVRRRLANPPPAPWPSVVLDREGFWAVVRNDSEDARAVLAASHQAGVPVLVSALVLAETLHGDGRDASAHRVLKRLEVVPVTESLARQAAGIKRVAGRKGVALIIDAVVVATAVAAGGGVVLTSDVDDIRALASHADGVRIRPVRV